jgi:hypothetical protein
MPRYADLPVAVDLHGTLAIEVTAYVENELGWQVVEVTGPPAPALLLAGTVHPDLPCAVVRDGAVEGTAVRDALVAGAIDVIGWPHDRARLAALPQRVADAVTADPPGPAPVLRWIRGAAGGVGTSTVALGLGGLVAWSGRRALVVGDDDLLRLCGHPPWTGPGMAELADVSGAEAAAAVADFARSVAGVEGLAVLGSGRCAGRGAVTVAGWPADVVIVDERTGGGPSGGVHPGRDDGGLVVARPDGALRDLLAAGGTGPVLLVGDGPVDRARVRRAVGTRLAGWLPWSARVARAGMAGAVPAGLPGSWVAMLRALGRSGGESG